MKKWQNLHYLKLESHGICHVYTPEIELIVDQYYVNAMTMDGIDPVLM